MKKIWIGSIYFGAVLLVSTGILFMINRIKLFVKTDYEFDYSASNVFESTYPVLLPTTSIIRPYTSESVTISKYYYDFESDEEEQENSLIFYENTYIQNSGIDYTNNEEFEIVSILSGEVISVEDNDILGNIVKIKHDNNIISVYQGVDNITVKESDSINQGQVIAVSGKKNINNENGNHLHFEIYHNGNHIDPENIYNLNIEDFH